MADYLDKLRKYVREYRLMSGFHPEIIHSLHEGFPEREAILKLSDLDALIAERDALKAQVAALQEVRIKRELEITQSLIDITPKETP